MTASEQCVVLAAQAWTGAAWQPVAAATDRPAPPRLRVVTWNVWFGAHRFDERAAALLAELERSRADVIALQEVTPELLALITAAPWVRAGYQLSDADGRTIERYGVIILARPPVRRIGVLGLPSTMGRRLVTAELACGLTVATVHLESMAGFEEARATQLGIILPHLATTTADAVLVGDMNFAPGDRREEAALDPGFVDAWAALHPGDPGYSVDSRRNPMRYQVKQRHSRERIDRVLVRSQRWRASAIELLGTEAIDPADTFVSDHFGLAVTLEHRRRPRGAAPDMT